MAIDRVDFGPLAQGGDDVTGALVKMDSNIAELADAIGDGGVSSIADRVTAAEHDIDVLQDGFSHLGTAASRNVGTVSNTVAAGDDARFLRMSGSKNRIINGRFDIWQRGTVAQYSNNFGAGNAFGFGPDRHAGQVYGGSGSSGTATCVLSQGSFSPGQTAVPGEPQFFARLNATSVPTLTSGGVLRMRYNVENVRTINGTNTYSVWLRADSARTIGVMFYQSFGTGGSGTAIAFQAQQAVTTTWTRYTFTFTPPSISGKTIAADSKFVLELMLYAQDNTLVPGMTIGPLGNFNTSAYLDMAMEQLEPGAFATDFDQRLLSEEVSRCRWYYRKSYDLTVAPGTATNTGMVDQYLAAATTAALSHVVFFGEPMRIAPTFTTYDTVGNIGKVFRGAQNQAAGTIIPGQSSTVVVIPAGASATEYAFQWTADAEIL